MKELIKKPIFALLLSCLLAGAAFSLATIFLQSRTPYYSSRIEIYSNGNAGEVMSAVENLKRKDVKITTYDQPAPMSTAAQFIRHCVSIALAFGVIWAIVNSLYFWLKKLLGTEGKLL